MTRTNQKQVISSITKLIKVEQIIFIRVLMYFYIIIYACIKQPFAILKQILNKQKQHQINFFFIKVFTLIIIGLLLNNVHFSYVYHLIKNQNIARIQSIQQLLDPVSLLLQYNLQQLQKKLYIQFNTGNVILYVLNSILMTFSILMKFVSMTIILLDGSFDIVSILVNSKFSEIKSVLITNLSPERQYKLFFQDSHEFFNMLFTMIFMNLLFAPSITNQITYICFELFADTIKIAHTLDFNQTTVETLKQMKLADINYYCLTEVKYSINSVSYIALIIYLSQYFLGFTTIQNIIGLLSIILLVTMFVFSNYQPVHKDVIEVDKLSKITLCSAP